MRCKAPRKGPRRTPQKEPVDTELHELAAVIAEHKLDDNAANWFKIPWRNGWNAIRLAMSTAFIDSINEQIEDSTIMWLGKVWSHKDLSPKTYWAAQDLLNPITTPNPMIRATLRCLQVLSAQSDGGGEVYNAILVEPFAKLEPAQVSNLVLEARCIDSIGVGHELEGDTNDRLRHAFTIAWRRGLYWAAYSLPQATTSPGLKVVRAT